MLISCSAPEKSLRIRNPCMLSKQESRKTQELRPLYIFADVATSRTTHFEDILADDDVHGRHVIEIHLDKEHVGT